jgi:hypothetical protein
MPGLMCAMRARQKGNVEGLKRGNGANARAESASILDATVSTAPTFVSRKMFILSTHLLAIRPSINCLLTTRLPISGP